MRQWTRETEHYYTVDLKLDRGEKKDVLRISIDPGSSHIDLIGDIEGAHSVAQVQQIIDALTDALAWKKELEA